MKVNKQAGQALLLVVLIMIVALTVGLSLAGRSIVNIRTSTEEADSQKALSAAEAGIEQALQTEGEGVNLKVGSTVNASYTTDVVSVSGAGPFLANGGNIAVQDDGVDIWLVDHDVDGKPDYFIPWAGTALNIYWGDPLLPDCGNAAIEVAVVSGTMFPPPPDLKLKRNVFDPCNTRRSGKQGNQGNQFSNVSETGSFVEGKFLYKAVISGIVSGLAARVVPIYTSTQIAVDGGGQNLPTQGFSIDSTGKSGSGDRQVKKSISHFKTYGQLATPYFTYGLFSP